MLGFAQQCFVEKVIREDGKDTLVSKLAASCSDFFNTSLETIRGSPLEAAFGPQWIGNLKAMGLYYSSLSQKRKAEEVLAGRKFGEHIGRLTIAVRDAQGAIGLGTTLPSFILSNMKTSLAGMQSVLDEANKDNDMIYHETIPDNKKLAILPRAEMVAPKDPLPEGVQTADLFRHVVPLHIHQASTKYEDSKDKVVMKISKDFDLAADEITRALNKLNLPGALESEVLKGLPDSILKRSEELRKRGAPNDLMNGVDQIKGLSGRAKALLEFCRDALEGERADDDQMRLDFGVKWTRPASSKVNSKLVANLDKYFSAYQVSFIL